MIINVSINNNFEINSLTDLVKLNMAGVKVNRSYRLIFSKEIF